jgi:hypothetical protein
MYPRILPLVHISGYFVLNLVALHYNNIIRTFAIRLRKARTDERPVTGANLQSSPLCWSQVIELGPAGRPGPARAKPRLALSRWHQQRDDALLEKSRDRVLANHYRDGFLQPLLQQRPAPRYETQPSLQLVSLASMWHFAQRTGLRSERDNSLAWTRLQWHRCEQALRLLTAAAAFSAAASPPRQPLPPRPRAQSLGPGDFSPPWFR